MWLAGVLVPDKLVINLATLLREEDLTRTAETLERAYDREAKIVALTIDDREAIRSRLPSAGWEPVCGGGGVP